MGLFRDNETNKFEWKIRGYESQLEASQLAIHNHGQGFELGTTKNKSS